MTKPAPQLENVYARTFLAFEEGEKGKLLRDFSNAPDGKIYQRFPTFLARRKWGQGRGFVPDLSRLELLLWMAATAPEIATSGFENVAAATEPDWYRARFRFDPGHRLLDSEWPLAEAFAQPGEAHDACHGTYLIYRTEGMMQFRQLKQNEAQLIRSLELGVPLGRVLERRDGPDFDAMTFHSWIESGLLRSIDWTAV